MSPWPTSQKGKIKRNEKFREQLYAALSGYDCNCKSNSKEREIGVGNMKDYPPRESRMYVVLKS